MKVWMIFIVNRCPHCAELLDEEHDWMPCCPATCTFPEEQKEKAEATMANLAEHYPRDKYKLELVELFNFEEVST